MDQQPLLHGLLHTNTSHNPDSENHSKSEIVLDSKYLETSGSKYLETGDCKFESLGERDLFGKHPGDESGNSNGHRESITSLDYSSEHQMNDYTNKQSQTCPTNGQPVSDFPSFYTPDPSVIASTNLNLSRLSSPLNSTTTLPLSRPRTNTLLHKSSHIGMRSSQNLSTLPFNSSTTSLRRASTAKLHHYPSKLDLIDDTTLTSLPLPPPAKLKLKSRSSGENTSLYSIEDINISFTPTQHDDSDNDDDTQDPIVLIEDYMTPLQNDLDHNLHKTSNEMTIDGPVPTSNENDDQLKHLIHRKRSLATFKQRIFKKSLQEVDVVSISDASITSTLNFDSIDNSHITRNTQSIASFPTHKPNNKRSISHDIVSRSDMNRFNSDVRLSDSTQLTDRSLQFRPENLEEIFGKIPGSDLLKYCDLCEKPLYEISSILNNNKKFKTCTGATTTATTIGQVYSEFICWECIETYEEFFNELYTTELDGEVEEIPEGLISSGLISSSGSISAPDAKSKLLKIFQSVHDKYTQQGLKASRFNETISAPSDKWTTSLNTTPSNPYKTWTSQLSSKRSFFSKQPTYKQLKNKTSFSETLMQRLNYLNNVPEGYSYNSNSLTETKSSFLGFVSETKEQKNNPAPKRDLEWIKNLQAKLRWSWRSLTKPLGSDVL